MYRIIDSHCHVYPEKISDKATEATGKFYDIEMDCSGTVSSLMKEMELSGIEHSIIQSVATTPKQVSSINRFIASAVGESDCFTGLGTLHPDSEDMEHDVNELVELGLKGVKLHPDIQGFMLDKLECHKIYELCEKNRLPILIHTGDKRYDNSNPNRLIPILESYDKLIIIGAHFGGWSIWKDAAKKLKDFKNLYVDTSSSLYALSTGDAEEIISMYSDDRILFATDFPMWKPTEEIERFMALNMSETQRQKFFFENAAELFNIR